MAYSKYVFVFLFLISGCSVTHSQSPASTEGLKVFDSRALSVFDPRQKVEVLAEGFSWSEGPVWVDELSCLLFSDIPNNKVLKYCPGIGLSTYIEDSSKANGLAVNNKRELVLMRGGARDLSVMKSEITKPGKIFQPLAQTMDGKRLNSPNDLVISKSGAIFFTDPPYELEGGLNSPLKELPYQGVFYLDEDQKLRLFDRDISWPNGVGLSNDERYLYLAVSDPEMPVWYRYELSKDKTLVDKRLFFDATTQLEKGFTQGLPDGLKVHSSGMVLASGPGGVWAFSETGELLARLLVADRPVSNLALDTKEQYMYLTADDQLLRLKLK